MDQKSRLMSPAWVVFQMVLRSSRLLIPALRMRAISFLADRADFTTAKRVAERINTVFGPSVATALDASSISVTAPVEVDQRVTYVSVLENLDIQQGQASAKVIINSRTGTIVVGSSVQVSPVAVTHGSLTVTVAENADIQIA